MRFLLFFLAPLVLAIPTPDRILHRETLEEAAVNVKRLIRNVNTGTMATVFPSSSDHAGQPFALMEYHAPCHPSPSLTMILLPISQSTRNILSDPAHHATYTVSSPIDHSKSPMSQGRVSFIGNVTILKADQMGASEVKRLEECYTSYHPDAKWWLPNSENGAHFSVWARLDPQDIYYVGGFGDTHYIGHIPLDLYTSADEQEEMSNLGTEGVRFQI